VSVRRVAPVARRAVVVRADASQKFDSEWLRRDPFVFGISFLGWTVPSSIPVSAFGGNSLFGSFMGSITENLAHFPTPPALDDKFW
jgi:photosystem I subunit PsaO